jgi:Flp pilus assembly protein TadD
VWGIEGRVRDLVREGKSHEAIGLLERNFGNATHSAKYLNLLGMCYAMAGKLDKAERSYVSSLEIQSDNAAALTGLGNLALLRGDPDRAREFYLQALRGNMLLLEPRYNLVFAYQDMGHFEKSLNAYRDFCVVQALRKWMWFLSFLAVGFLLTYALIR